jgi:S-adenosylmethionine decarboxylase proenzyme
LNARSLDDAEEVVLERHVPLGCQWVADFFDCTAPADLLERADQLEAMSMAAVRDSGLTPIGRRFHQFEPAGATGVILLAESHLALHTWPELRFTSLDLYVCNFLTDNTVKAQRLFDLVSARLVPGRVELRRLDRGNAAQGQ